MDETLLAFQAALAGRYSLDREIGRGGMGIVYLAREVRLDRSVAIKLLPPERAQRSLRERFLREARLAAQLSHPNIIPIHSVEEEGDFVFYVMAYIDGETLAQRVRDHGPMPVGEGTRVLREVAWALGHAHERGLVHRDVKPDNVILEASSGRVLVADFGIAAAMTESTGDGIAGTPEFMSPEQALGTQLDARSDLYSLGATAFFAFSGRYPFEGKTPTEVLAKQVTEPAPTLIALGLQVPKKVSALVDHCLAKLPDERPESANVLAEQLGVALELRKEMPVALRGFVKRGARINGPGLIVSWFTISAVSVWIGALTDAAPGFASLALLSIASPLAYMTNVARRLLRLGFAHRDLDPAFKSEAERTKEELYVEQRVKPLAIEKYLPAVTKASWAVYGSVLLSIVLWETSPAVGRYIGRGGLSDLIRTLFFTMGPVAIASTATLLALRQRHRDADTEFWGSLWTGRIGKAAFALANKLLKPGDRQTAMTHRATELSLGMAAEQLYETLPKETRASLGEIPAILTRLQDDAQALRKHLEGINDALSSVGAAAAGSEYASARATRDALQSRLADTVGALETIRLNLLRLHAGSTSVESVTTHLGLAAEVSAQVERLIAAHGDIADALKYPRPEVTTPV